MSTSRSIRDQQSDVGTSDKVSDAVQQAKGKISEFTSNASDRVDQGRATAASGVESAAETLHQHADSLPGGPTVSNLAHSTADKMNVTADYVRQHDISDMMGDVEDLVKRNPGPSLLIAAGLGFLIGHSFSGSRG